MHACMRGHIHTAMEPRCSPSGSQHSPHPLPAGRGSSGRGYGSGCGASLHPSSSSSCAQLLSEGQWRCCRCVPWVWASPPVPPWEERCSITSPTKRCCLLQHPAGPPCTRWKTLEGVCGRHICASSCRGPHLQFLALHPHPVSPMQLATTAPRANPAAAAAGVCNGGGRSVAPRCAPRASRPSSSRGLAATTAQSSGSSASRVSSRVVARFRLQGGEPEVSSYEPHVRLQRRLLVPLSEKEEGECAAGGWCARGRPQLLSPSLPPPPNRGRHRPVLCRGERGAPRWVSSSRGPAVLPVRGGSRS